MALHTFAHAMIRELALECGYSAADTAERVYARSGDQPMAGVHAPGISLLALPWEDPEPRA